MAEEQSVKTTNEITAPIDDYLITIADSLQRVQKQLNNAKVLSPDGQSFTTYQLPRLDFELKMSIHLEVIEEGEGVKRSFFNAIPSDALSRGRNTSQFDESSTIKGAFVAVPSDLGKPPSLLRTLVQKVSSSKFNILVNVISAVGEPQRSVDVHFNLDRTLSIQLNVDRSALAKAIAEAAAANEAADLAEEEYIQQQQKEIAAVKNAALKAGAAKKAKEAAETAPNDNQLKAKAAEAEAEAKIALQEAQDITSRAVELRAAAKEAKTTAAQKTAVSLEMETAATEKTATVTEALQQVSFTQAVVPTDENGNAASTVEIATEEEIKVAVIIDAASKTETIVVSGQQA